jgi:BASS family bile acid:Na+ symporter
MTERDCRTIAIEVGAKRGLASGLSKAMGKIATVGLAPVFGPTMNVTGSILASYWHRKPLKETPR